MLRLKKFRPADLAIRTGSSKVNTVSQMENSSPPPPEPSTCQWARGRATDQAERKELKERLQAQISAAASPLAVREMGAEADAAVRRCRAPALARRRSHKILPMRSAWIQACRRRPSKSLISQIPFTLMKQGI